MLKRNSLALLSLLCAVFIFNSSTAQAQETEAAANSAITAAKLPAGAQRIMPASVPAEISDALKELANMGEGKVVQGDREVLPWSGGGYRRANAATLMRQVQNGLQAQGWTYEVGGTEGDLTIFTVLKETPTRRSLIGFYVPTDAALVVAWTEVLRADNRTNAVENNAQIEKVVSSSVSKSESPREFVGTWTNGGMSMLLERNTVTGSTTPRNGSTFKYVFTHDKRFESIGMIQSTMYGCTTTLFNDKRGRVEINGSQLMLVPSKNFWRQQNSCAPNSTKERDYTLERETFEWRTKTDEYGEKYICLTNAKGERCYRLEDK
ncbi:MAG: hypothetical protein H0T92_24240 [Pyrinomonadaceae bacterium]|nr:hypothetical protein [Pyrinomonadaceae bacterium]